MENSFDYKALIAELEMMETQIDVMLLEIEKSFKNLNNQTDDEVENWSITDKTKDYVEFFNGMEFRTITAKYIDNVFG